MSKSPNLGLNLTPITESTKTFLDYRTEMASDNEDSNMMILDTEIGKLSEKCEKYDGTPVTWGMLKNGLGFTSES